MVRRQWLGSLGFLMLVSCADRVTIRESAFGAKTQREVGFEVELTHVRNKEFARQKPGFYAVMSPSDWTGIWDTSGSGTKAPPVPDINWKTQMALVAVPSAENASAVEIDRVIQTARPDMLHVYVNTELLGDRCVRQGPKNVLKNTVEAVDAPIDVVIARRSNIEIVVHEDRAKGLSCDPVPTVTLKCAITGHDFTDSRTITASPGNLIECDGSNAVAKVGFIADRDWYFERRPPDSFSKLDVSGEKETHAEFKVDAFGEYQVRVEAIDNRTKRGMSVVTIDVLPPDDVTLMQFGWSQYDRKDDPAKFPKYEVHILEAGFPIGTKGKDCTEADSTSFCEFKKHGFAKQAFLKPAKGARYKVAVKYLDARGSQNPVLCTHTFFKSSTAAMETCDFKDRDAGALWEPGAINFDTSGFEDPNKPHVAPRSFAIPKR